MELRNNSLVRVLQVLPGGSVFGGIENFVLNYYRNIDRSKVQFDFIFNYSTRVSFEDEITSLGGKVFYFSGRENKRIIQYMKELYSFFREHPEYQIIHGHMPGFAPIYFSIAKICGLKVRISHCHVNGTEPTLKGRVLERIIKSTKHFSNFHWACSGAAGDYMYGSSPYEVIPNAISLERFCFKPEIREQIRKQLNLSDRFVIGNVGRFALQKNQMYLVKLFKDVLAEYENATLMLIGEGDLEAEILNTAKELGVDDKVILLHNQKNIEDYYQAMDVFVMPSLFEGLGIVIAEALACGVPCVASTGVPQEANLTGNVQFVDLSEPSAAWIKAIQTAVDTEPRDTYAMVQAKGYEIKSAGLNLTEKYVELYNRYCCE